MYVFDEMKQLMEKKEAIRKHASKDELDAITEQINSLLVEHFNSYSEGDVDPTEGISRI